MSDDDRLLEVLTRIEANQRKALAAQQQHLQVAQAQLERSNKTIQESMELQRASVARQVQIIRFVIPLTGILLLLLGYLLVKWRVIFY